MRSIGHTRNARPYALDYAAATWATPAAVEAGYRWHMARCRARQRWLSALEAASLRQAFRAGSARR